MSPPDLFYSRDKILNRVDFPHPFGPIRPIISPELRLRSTDSKTVLIFFFFFEPNSIETF